LHAVARDTLLGRSRAVSHGGRADGGDGGEGLASCGCLVGGVLQAESCRPRWLRARGQNRLERHGAPLQRATWPCTVVQRGTLRRGAPLCATCLCVMCGTRRCRRAAEGGAVHQQVPLVPRAGTWRRTTCNTWHRTTCNTWRRGTPRARARRLRCGAKGPYPTDRHTHAPTHAHTHPVLARKCRAGATVAWGVHASRSDGSENVAMCGDAMQCD
jgi:hypothetical protein